MRTHMQSPPFSPPLTLHLLWRNKLKRKALASAMAIYHVHSIPYSTLFKFKTFKNQPHQCGWTNKRKQIAQLHHLETVLESTKQLKNYHRQLLTFFHVVTVHAKIKQIAWSHAQSFSKVHLQAWPFQLFKIHFIQLLRLSHGEHLTPATCSTFPQVTLEVCGGGLRVFRATLHGRDGGTCNRLLCVLFSPKKIKTVVTGEVNKNNIVV